MEMLYYLVCGYLVIIHYLVMIENGYMKKRKITFDCGIYEKWKLVFFYQVHRYAAFQRDALQIQHV